LETLATSAHGAHLADEHPQLYWKRDATTHVGLEKRVEGNLALTMLYHELAFNITYSFYPCTLHDAVELAAMALKVEKGFKATKADMKALQSCKLPIHLRKKSWEWTWYRKVWNGYSKIASEPGSAKQWQKQYLTHGHRFHYYGAVFFYGGLEHDMEHHPDHTVRVGVNMDGVHVIDDHRNVVLLDLGYDEFTYHSYVVPPPPPSITDKTVASPATYNYNS
jgi:hypothetical protein